MLISEAACKSGLSVHTIRFYEKSELLPPIRRGADGNRYFSNETIDWLILLASLRDTGMPLKRMKYFADLYKQGNKTISQRKKILLEHSANLEHKKMALEKCASLLTAKLQIYENILGEKP